MATLANFRQSIAYELGLDNTTSSTDQTEIDRRINEGVTKVLSRTHCKVVCADLTMTSGTWKYTLPTSSLAIKEVWITSSGQNYRLERVTTDEILDFRTSTTDSNSPSRYYAVEGANLLLVWPTPSAADTLEIFYVPSPATLSSSSDTPSEIPSEYHTAVERYALWKLSSAVDDVTSAQGQRYRDEYEQELYQLRKHLRNKGGRRLAPAKVGRRPIVPHDNSADWR